MSSVQASEEKVVLESFSNSKLNISISVVENKWGVFYKAVLKVEDAEVDVKYARHPDRAIGFVLRAYAERLVEESRG